MATSPAKKIIREGRLSLEILPARKRIYATNRLNSAHSTFTVGDESPLPGGWEKGVGNCSPEMP